eukprot:gene690-37396_t
MVAAVVLTAVGASIAWDGFGQRAQHSHRPLGLVVLFAARPTRCAAHVVGGVGLLAAAAAAVHTGARNYAEMWDDGEARRMRTAA